MDQRDHVGLIEGGVRNGGTVWADLGSGNGAFTLALAELLGPGGTIHSVDRDAGVLREQARAMNQRFPGVTLLQQRADFTRPLDLPALDGVVMANSLHFVRDKVPVLALVGGYLRAGGRLVLVEYDAERGNPWVPYPVSFRTWPGLASAAGFPLTRLLARVPSRFLGAIYAALTTR
ncbi:MAG: class I SAM-dependent methyltransferase [Candidatus Limnocylindrales bacterium]